MKKVFIAAVLLLSVSTAFAQLNLGIKAGYTSSLSTTNLSSVTGGSYNLNSVNSELTNNFHAGIFARVGFAGVYFQPELLYAMGKKKYQITYNDALNPNLVTADRFITVGTIDVPLLIGYKLLDLKVVNLRAFAGPKLRFNAGSKLSMESLPTATPTDLITEAKGAQVGLEAGIGIDVLMFTLDARYNLIGDMYTTKLNGAALDNIPAGNFVISLGYKLF